MRPKTASPSPEIAYFDGLRGSGAAIVYLTHMGLSGLAPIPLPPPFGFLANGAFAVEIFFALSGVVMAMAASRSQETILAISTRRYVRLAVPAAASCILSACLLFFGLYFNQYLAAQNGSQWLSMWFGFQPSFIDALWEGFIGIFAHPVSAYNSSLWTMRFELLCSLAIFGAIYLFRWRWLCFIVALFAAYYFGISTMMAPLSFCVGAAAYFLRYWLLPPMESAGRLTRAAVGTIATVVVCYGFYLGAYPGFDGKSILYTWFPGSLTNGQWAASIGGSLVVLAIGWSPPFAWLFSTPPFRRLGKISFSFYLLHLPILCSLGAWLAISTQNRFLPLIVTTPAVIVCAWLFERMVDQRAISLSRAISRTIDLRLRTLWERTMPDRHRGNFINVPATKPIIELKINS